MTESSLFWPTTGVGDGAASGVTSAQMVQWLRALLRPVSGANEGGINPNFGGGLAVSGASSPVSVASGAAHVYGYPYLSDSVVNVAVPTPVGGTRIDRIALRVDWTAQTVRITHIAGTPGGGAPALTQTPGVAWDVPLAQLSVTTGGAITVTDQRVFLKVGP